MADVVRGGSAESVNSMDGYQMLVLVAETVVILVLATRAYLRSDVSFE